MGWEESGGEGDKELISMSCKAQYDALLRLFALVKDTFVMELFRQLYTGEIPVRNRKNRGFYKLYCRTALAILRAGGPCDLCWTFCRCVMELVMRQRGCLHGQQPLLQHPGCFATHRQAIRVQQRKCPACESEELVS